MFLHTNYLRGDFTAKEVFRMILDKIALALSIIGGLNWGLIGLFNFDLVAFIGGGSGTWFSRVIYVIVGLAALWCLTLLFRPALINGPV